MFKQNFLCAVSVCLAATVSAFGQNPGYLFQFAGPNSSGGQISGYVATSSPFNATISATGPAGIYRIIAKPDGTKFYVLGTSGVNAVQSVDATFTNFRSINGIAAVTTAAVITPDGRYLLVGADLLYIIDTATDQIVGGAGVALPSTPVVGIAVNPSSTRAYVLTQNASATASTVTAIDLTTRQRIGAPLTLTGGASGITFSPLGLLYVTAINVIYEINPATLTVTQNGSIIVFFHFGPLRFTPDGTMALSVSPDANSGGSIAMLNVATHAVTKWPPPNFPLTAPSFDDVIVAGNSRAFAFSSASSTLYDITFSPLLGAVVSTSLGLPQNVIQNVLAVAGSNEIPSARYLFFLAANGNQLNLYRVDLSTNQVTAQVFPAMSSPFLQFVGVPAQSGASGFVQFNNNQILTGGATSAPLIARVLDAQGRPVFNLPVIFTNADPGLVITSPNQVTNADGYVQTTVTLPGTSGVYTVTLNAGTASAPFTLTVPVGAGGGGGGGGGGSTQVKIVSGDGQLFPEIQFFQALPLTILVTDTAGKPLPNVPVSFTVTSGIGVVGTNLINTDSNGLASTIFFPQTIPQGSSFQASTVNASTAFGSVNFTETIFHANSDGSGLPEINILSPLDFHITAGQGTPIPNAIIAQIHAGNFPSVGAPIPGVGITIQNSFDQSLPAPATCIGSSNSDQMGIARCTLVAACPTTVGGVRFGGVGTFGMDIVVGGIQHFPGTLRVTSGSATAVAISGGNNQSGRAGQSLTPLIALVTDGCGTPVAGVPVTWTVVSGSATLSATTNTSNSQGFVSTGITLGSTPGPVTVRVALGSTAQATFQLTNVIVVGGVTVTGGNNQVAVTGQTFAQPVTFRVRDVNNNPVAGILVTFGVTGSATLNPQTVNTDSQGNASTTVTAGIPAGPILITATVGSFSASATLTSRPPGPVVTGTSFVNAASNAVGLVPCGLSSVVGTGLAPGLQGVVSGISPFGPLPYVLNGLGITVNGIPAPIQSVSNQNGKEQVNFQTPCEVQPGTATVIVQLSGGSTTVNNVPVLQGQPGIFTYQGPTGRTYGAVIRAADGSYVTPSNPARRGETYYLVVTGLGQTTPPAITNSAGVAGQTVNLQVVVGVNNAGVPVLSGQSLYLVGSIGVYIVGFQIPLDAPTGPDQPLAVGLIINGQLVFGNSVFLPGVI